MSLSISYKVTGAGWAECVIVADKKSIVLTASYLDDALGNLAEATLSIAEGEKLAYAVFAEEPGEFRWKISKTNDKEVLVEILEFDDWEDFRQTDEKGKVIFEFECELLQFVRKIITCLSEVLNENGLEGYIKKWLMHEFPLKTYNELRNSLQKLRKI